MESNRRVTKHLITYTFQPMVWFFIATTKFLHWTAYPKASKEVWKEGVFAFSAALTQIMPYFGFILTVIFCFITANAGVLLAIWGLSLVALWGIVSPDADHPRENPIPRIIPICIVAVLGAYSLGMFDLIQTYQSIND
ncbi:hypothetical protein ASL83_003423 [Vibrio parahaemolyticus]|nr:hypothetical protein [Vibrio parahaemolyticus]